jgi:hypothetical protein
VRAAGASYRVVKNRLTLRAARPPYVLADCGVALLDVGREPGSEHGGCYADVLNR